MQGDPEEARRAQADMARASLRNEVEFEVSKDVFDLQARRLRATCYPYAEAQYREDLVEEPPATWRAASGRTAPRTTPQNQRWRAQAGRWSTSTLRAP